MGRSGRGVGTDRSDWGQEWTASPPEDPALVEALGLHPQADEIAVDVAVLLEDNILVPNRVWAIPTINHQY